MVALLTNKIYNTLLLQAQLHECISKTWNVLWMTFHTFLIFIVINMVYLLLTNLLDLLVSICVYLICAGVLCVLLAISAAFCLLVTEPGLTDGSVRRKCGCQMQLKSGARTGSLCGLRTVYNSNYCRRHSQLLPYSALFDTIRCQVTEESNIQCVICMTNKRNVAFQPCHHLAVCARCVQGLQICPICRSSIGVIAPIIIS